MKIVPAYSGRPASPAAGTPFSAGSSPAGPAEGIVGLSDRRAVVWVCICLAAMVWLVFGRTAQFDFVDYDDNLYVYENPAVTAGLSLQGVKWAFTHAVAFNWHPLTVLSHMLDCQLYGLKAGGHHLTNVLLHAATVIFLFLVLRQMTAKLWRSAMVAALFAIHPLRVESVAWVSERKDVLSGFFFMLTLWAYVRYTRHPFSRGRYLSVVALFAFGLLAKPMLVTLPFVLLLLDYWPLGRFQWTTPRATLLALGPLFREKIPLFLLAAVACVVAFMAQANSRATLENLPMAGRFTNAIVSYGTYAWDMAWPRNLAAFYPAVSTPPVWQIAGAGALLLVVTALAIRTARQNPYVLAGWLWYLGMLVPVIGLVQVGSQSHADRYTYLPQIGLYMMLTWAAAEGCARWRLSRVALGGAAAMILVALMVCARAQASYWRNSESLWTHTLACTADNALAHFDLGFALLQSGRANEAAVHFQQALQIKPRYAAAHNHLGRALLQLGRADEAVGQFQQALQIDPADPGAHVNLANALLGMGQVSNAVVQFEQALQINPADAGSHNNLGNALLQMGQLDGAVAQYEQALQINSNDVGAHNNLGYALLLMGRLDEAIVHYQKVLQLKPDESIVHDNLGKALFRLGRESEAMGHFQRALQINPGLLIAQNDLAWALATASQASLRDGPKAVELAERANQSAGGRDPGILRTLAAACAETGRFDDAVRTAQKALALARSAGQAGLAGQLDAELKLYAAKLPLHQQSRRSEN